MLRTDLKYYDENRTPDPTLTAMSRVNYTGPSRMAGEAVIVLESYLDLNQSRKTWQYLPGPAPRTPRARALLRHAGPRHGRHGHL